MQVQNRRRLATAWRGRVWPARVVQADTAENPREFRRAERRVSANRAAEERDVYRYNHGRRERLQPGPRGADATEEGRISVKDVGVRGRPAAEGRVGPCRVSWGWFSRRGSYAAVSQKGGRGDGRGVVCVWVLSGLVSDSSSVWGKTNCSLSGF